MGKATKAAVKGIRNKKAEEAAQASENAEQTEAPTEAPAAAVKTKGVKTGATKGKKADTRTAAEKNPPRDATKEADSVARGLGKEILGKKIKLLVENNPKAEGSAARDRFALYKDGMTVTDFIRRGGKAIDIKWDMSAAHRGGPFIELTD